MEGDRFHNVYRFPNGYGASIVSKPKSSHDTKGFIVLVIRFQTDPPDYEYAVDRTTPLTDDVILCDDWESVEGVIEDIMGL
jgi:hypothetical protein